MFRFFIVSIVFLMFMGENAESSQTLTFNQAQEGDYLVTNHGKTYTLFHITQKTPLGITIEEVTVPSDRFKRLKISWREWMRQGSPHHSSWIQYSLNLNTGKIQSFYDAAQDSWLKVSDEDLLLTTLLHLKLQPTPEHRRKKVGPPPLPGELDRRRLWHPQMVVDGKKIQNVTFTAWQTTWPNDNSELANKLVEIYLPEKNDQYPNYFPYWLQITGNFGKAKIRVVDSGKALLRNSTTELTEDTERRKK